MEVNNPLYKNQGIHVITAIFTVDRGKTKVLLIKRKNEPFKDMWALVGGALYNNEKLIVGAKREIKEKTGIDNIDLYYSNVFDEVKRSPVQRMIAFSYIGLIDINKAIILKNTLKTSNAEWFDIDDIPKLAYDHIEILEACLNTLKTRILSTTVLRNLFPKGFTIPEIQDVYETILNKKFDRRNFRKKLLSLGLIEDTGISINYEGNKPAKLYRFKKNKEDKNVF